MRLKYKSVLCRLWHCLLVTLKNVMKHVLRGKISWCYWSHIWCWHCLWWNYIWEKEMLVVFHFSSLASADPHMFLITNTTLESPILMQLFYKVISIIVFVQLHLHHLSSDPRKRVPPIRYVLNMDFITYSLKVIPAGMIGLPVLSLFIIPASIFGNCQRKGLAVR